MSKPNISRRVLVVADPRERPAQSGEAPVRRYRLARLGQDERAASGSSRFAHLARTYD